MTGSPRRVDNHPGTEAPRRPPAPPPPARQATHLRATLGAEAAGGAPGAREAGPSPSTIGSDADRFGEGARPPTREGPSSVDSLLQAWGGSTAPPGKGEPDRASAAPGAPGPGPAGSLSPERRAGLGKRLDEVEALVGQLEARRGQVKSDPRLREMAVQAREILKGIQAELSGGTAPPDRPVQTDGGAPPVPETKPTPVPPSPPEVVGSRPGQRAPEVQAQGWLNAQGQASLAGRKGEVSVVEFWGTFCGPCRKAIPHLNEVQDKYRAEGLQVLALSGEDRQTVDEFRQKVPMNFPVGYGSRSSQDYGVSSVPHSVVVGRDGKVVWSGHPLDGQNLEQAIKSALGAPRPARSP